MIPRWVDRYIGIPFAERGSSRDGCNCWGLCALVFSERTGIEINRYAEISSEQLIASVRAIARGKRGYQSITRDEVQPLDFVVMRSFKTVNGKPHVLLDHVGIMVSPLHLLHIELGINAACLSLDHFSLKPRIATFHRHQA